MNIISIIPARLNSSRFPNKPLAKIQNKPMIKMVYNNVKGCKIVNDCIVATCDSEIKEIIETDGGKCIMTSSSHERASDRCAEALEIYEKKVGYKFDIVLMVQGDEPLISHKMIEQSVKPIINDSNIEIVNLMSKIKSEEEFNDPNCVKVVIDKNSFALFFSREPIPTLKRDKHEYFYKQVCVIPFRRDFLLEYNSMKPTSLEEIESIDMLRILENGKKVKMIETKEISQCVDTEEDLLKVEKILARMND